MPTAKKKVAAPASSLAQLRGNLEKAYGKQVVRRDQVVPYEVISTGSLTLDLATRVGGWVRGRLHEVVGPEGVGKTTVAISSMVEAQRQHKKLAVGYIDMEQTFDYDWAEALGLDTSKDRWFHIYPDDSEDVADVLRKQIETGLFSMVVVDSIGGMESKQAFEKESGDSVVGRNAQVITRMVKQCAVLARKSQTAVLLINQYRANISNPMGSDISAGPKALKYSTTMRVDMGISMDDPIRYRLPGDTEDSTIGRKVRARVSRNKVAVQGKNSEFYLINADTKEYGPVGIDKADEAITIGLYTEVIEQGGGWYHLPLTKGQEKRTRIQGREKLGAHLRSCPDDLELVRTAAIATMSGDVHEETEVVLEHSS
jgi:recombination protein RecA